MTEENNKKYLVELLGERDLRKLSFIRSQGLMSFTQEQPTPKTGIVHSFTINGQEVTLDVANDEIISFSQELEFSQNLNNFEFSNSDNYGWNISFSINGKIMKQVKRRTELQAKVRMGNVAIVTIPQIPKLFRKERVRAKLGGFQFGGKLRQRLGKNNQISAEAENIKNVQKIQTSEDEYADFVQDEGEKTPAWRKYLDSLDLPHIKKAREKQKKGRLGLFQK